jgi:hypothetical protein
MKVYKTLTKSLDRFRTRSITHPMAFSWNGTSMMLYQNGSKFVISDLFSGCFMPSKTVKGIILPTTLSSMLDAQQFIDDNLEDLLISPKKWGYDIYKLNPNNANPLLVHELRFYSIKGIFPVFIAKFFFKDLRVALKNV